MFVVNQDKSIYLTRGDIATLAISIDASSGKSYVFQKGDIIRIRVFEKNHYDRLVLQKDTIVESESQVVDISLTKDDTKIGEIINKPVDYWYEIELNPETLPQTIIGHDIDGPKIFKLLPEGADKE